VPENSSTVLRRLLRSCWFLVGVGLVLLVAYLAPAVGLTLGRLGFDKLAVVAMFLITGLVTASAGITRRLGNWRCHALVQGFSFVLSPALIYATTWWLAAGPVKDGLYLIGALPTTASSCVAFTVAAGGSGATAVVNAVGGNFLGVFISPFLLGLLTGEFAAHGLSGVGTKILRLCLLVLLPFIVGQGVRRGFPAVAGRLRGSGSYLAQACVLLLMLSAFSKSLDRILADAPAMWPVFAYLVGLHLCLVAAATAASAALRLTAAESAAAMFCASQKTMALGIPLAEAFFSGAAVGLIVLPLVFYHFFQVSFAAVLVPLWSRRISLRARVRDVRGRWG